MVLLLHGAEKQLLNAQLRIEPVDELKTPTERYTYLSTGTTVAAPMASTTAITRQGWSATCCHKLCLVDASSIKPAGEMQHLRQQRKSALNMMLHISLPIYLLVCIGTAGVP